MDAAFARESHAAGVFRLRAKCIRLLDVSKSAIVGRDARFGGGEPHLQADVLLRHRIAAVNSPSRKQILKTDLQPHYTRIAGGNFGRHAQPFRCLNVRKQLDFSDARVSFFGARDRLDSFAHIVGRIPPWVR